MDIKKSKEILVAFNLAGIVEIITQEEFEDVKQAIETVLSELEKKEAIINEMSNFINLMSNELVAETGDNNLEFCKTQKCIENGELDCEECIKEYFTKKAEKEGIKEYFTKKAEKEGIKDEQSR